MFGIDLECGIRAVKVVVKEVDGREFRRCRVTLAHEFTSDIASALGPDAEALREGLRSLAIEKATLPIEGIAAMGAFKAGRSDAVTIGRLTGCKAVCTAPKGDATEGPTVQLEFEFTWDEAAWVFLGRHCNAIASVVLTQRQLSLAAGAEA